MGLTKHMSKLTESKEDDYEEPDVQDEKECIECGEPSGEYDLCRECFEEKADLPRAREKLQRRKQPSFKKIAKEEIEGNIGFDLSKKVEVQLWVLVGILVAGFILGAWLL